MNLKGIYEIFYPGNKSRTSYVWIEKPKYRSQKEFFEEEYSNAIVHALQKLRVSFSGKIVNIFPEQSAVI